MFKGNFSKNSGFTFFLIAALAGVAVLWLAPRRAPRPVVPGHATAADTNEEKAERAVRKGRLLHRAYERSKRSGCEL